MSNLVVDSRPCKDPINIPVPLFGSRGPVGRVALSIDGNLGPGN